MMKLKNPKGRKKCATKRKLKFQGCKNYLEEAQTECKINYSGKK